MFALIAGVGLSQMQYADQNSPRNIFILGFAIYMGLSVPNYFVRPKPFYMYMSYLAVRVHIPWCKHSMP